MRVEWPTVASSATVGAERALASSAPPARSSVFQARKTGSPPMTVASTRMLRIANGSTPPMAVAGRRGRTSAARRSCPAEGTGMNVNPDA